MNQGYQAQVQCVESPPSHNITIQHRDQDFSPPVYDNQHIKYKTKGWVK